MRKFLLLPLILFLSGPAQAELTDIRARLAGESGRIWLAFDQQPRDVVATPGDAGLVLEVHGVNDVARAIEPAHRDLVDAIRLVPDGAHLRIELSAARAWTNARAEIRQGGVLIEVGVSTSTMPLARIRSGHETEATAAAPAAGAGPSGQAVPSAPAPAAPVITPPRAPQAPQIDVPAPAVPAAPEAPAAPAAPAELAPPPPAQPAQPPEQVAQSVPEAPATPAAPAPDRCAQAAAAVEEDPWNDTALMVHAGCLNAAGSRREAAGIYAQMLAFEPENTEAALALAEIHVAEGNRAEAAALYRQVASQSRSDAAAAAALQRARELEQ
jgi:hypothetical protein